MRKPIRQQTTPLRSRGGFTLVELMIVIVIIAILLGLLIPAISAVRGKARVAQVKTEIADLTQAITEFKVTYGVEPPSMITLHEVGGTWDARSRAIIRRMWPQCNFGVGADRDFNDDGSIDADPDGDGTDGITLTGAECLVFFLGGVIDRGPGSNDSGAQIGFSKNPANPFAIGGNREGPFYEFQPGRLIDLKTVNGPSGPEGNGFPEFVDIFPNQQTPYLYVSSYDGRGYPNPLVNPSALDLAVFRSSRDMTSVYRSGSAAAAPGYKPNGFQIISPGIDGEYGSGGPFDPKGSEKFPGSTGREVHEADNITNFHGAVLGG